MRRDVEVAFLFPVSALLGALVAVPSLLVAGYSFYEWAYVVRGEDLSLANYVAFFSDPATCKVIKITLVIAVPVSMISVVVGYCVAYYIVFGQGVGRQALLVLTITAVMASYLVRIYAWRILLGNRGIINGALIGLGIIDRPLDFILFSPVSVVIAERACLIPLAALIFFAALTGVSRSLLEAARDLGASAFMTFRRITLPLTGPAVLTTTALTVFLACGDYLTPLYVGGPNSVTVGRLIADYFGPHANYGLGAAYSVMLFIGYAAIFFALRTAMGAGRFLPVRVT